MEVVINTKTKDISLTSKGIKHYADLKGITLYPFQINFYDNYYTNSHDKQVTRLTWEQAENTMFVSFFTQDSTDNEFYFSPREIERDDEALIQTIKDLGEEAYPSYCHLRIMQLHNANAFKIYKSMFGEVVVNPDNEESFVTEVRNE